jgi:hypothetical protein
VESLPPTVAAEETEAAAATNDEHVLEEPATQATEQESAPEMTQVEEATAVLVPVIAEGVQESEQTEEPAAAAPESTADALSPAEPEERPKSPWTPSYSVTTQGNGIPEENADVQEIEQLPPVAVSHRTEVCAIFANVVF